MKQFILIMSIALSINAYAQDDKTVTLVVSGQGKTQDEAKQNALRSAIEQAFGTFISSKTEILNDNLVKDEIVSVANGNIQKFEIISEVQIPNGGFAISLSATVSVSKLTSFVESKGVEIEFQGSIFGENMKLQKINENAELKATINLCEVANEILSNSIDYSIDIDDPIKPDKNFHNYPFKEDDFLVTFTVKAFPNENFDLFEDYFYSSLRAISMSASEQENYMKINKEIYYFTINRDSPIILDKKKKKKKKKKNNTSYIETFFFRDYGTAVALQNLFMKSNQYLHNFRIIVSNLDTINVKTCCYDYDGSSTHNISGGFEQWSLNWWRHNSAGYPDFRFVYRNSDYSSWQVYINYLFYLESNDILFDPENYFTQDSESIKSVTTKWWLIQNQKFEISNFPGFHHWDYRVQNQPSRNHKYIGILNLKKQEHFHLFKKIYSEEEISKITKILVEQNDK